MPSTEKPDDRTARLEREEWARFENTIAAILTLAVAGTSGNSAEFVIATYGDMVQRLRHGDALNPPILDTRPR
jgi:hypothetical protein